jgi:hypothetical protein
LPKRILQHPGAASARAGARCAYNNEQWWNAVGLSGARHPDDGGRRQWMERMYYAEEGGTASFIAGVLIGAMIGASVALLTTPQTGKRMRRRLVKSLSTARESATDRWDDLSDDVRSAVETGRKRIHI